jgi:hypothetical protein
MSKLLDQEMVKNDLLVLNVKSFEPDQTEKGLFHVHVDLEGTNAWKWGYEKNTRFPEAVDELMVDVRYISHYDCHKYHGYTGFIGSVECTEQVNRRLGCFGQRLELPEHMYEYMSTIRNNPYVRSACEGGTVIYTVRMEDNEALMTATDKVPELKHVNTHPQGNSLSQEFELPACQHIGKCAKCYMKTTHYPKVRIPLPGQEEIEAKTGAAKRVAAAAAGIMNRILDPTWPDSPGIWNIHGQRSKYKYSISDYQNCLTCDKFRQVRRGSDEDSELGQSSIAQTKIRGIDAEHFCAFQNAWLPSLYQTLVDINQSCLARGSAIAQKKIWEAGQMDVLTS